jgi:AcrR family transcriptional regulator
MKAAKPGGRSAYHHGNLRAQLIEATRGLVEEKGPDHFSVSEACRAAGVSTAAPYRHFRDREEMIAAVAAEGMRRHYEEMVGALEGLPPGSLDRIRALGRVYVGFARREPGVFRLIFGSKHDPDLLAMQEGSDVRPFETVLDEVAAILGRSGIDEEVTRRGLLLWTFVHGLSFLLIDEVPEHKGLAVDVEALLEDVARRVLPEAADV